MQFWIKVVVAVGILLGAGGAIRLLWPGSESYDIGETVGMLLISALLVAIGIYLLQFKKQHNPDQTEAAQNATKAQSSYSIPMWAVLALLLSGVGASASQHGAVAFLLGFAIFGLVFWAIERAVKAAWRRARGDAKNS
jgi:cobalamin synthase